MDDPTNVDALVERFGELTPDIVAEFLSMLRIYAIDDQELFFKWESYCIKMGSEDTKLNFDTVCAFKKDVQEQLEKTSKARSRQYINNAPRAVQKTPRHMKGDGLVLFDSLVPTTPRSANGSVKRKFDKAYDTPSKSSRLLNINSPSESPFASSPIRKLESLSIDSTSFSTRTNAGATIEILNEHIPRPILPLPESALTADRAVWDNRVKLLANQEFKKFSYRPMHQKLTEASEVQNDRIDDFRTAVKDYYQLSNEQFGNPSSISPSEIVAVGRIASDSLDGKLNTASVVLESSRLRGAGSRVPLKLDAVRSYSFFPGQIVAMKGVNASGAYFAVSEILEIPPLPAVASSPASLAAAAEQLAAGPLSVVVASGPYTTDDNLLFESLDEICRYAAEMCPDVLILLGPFIDCEHPLVQVGDFDIEGIDPTEGGTVEDLFRERISSKIRKVGRSMVIVVPSIRDAASKHVAYPQEALKKKALELSPNVKCLPNPAIFSLNEVVFGISTPDILFHLSHEEVRLNPTVPNPLARLSKAIVTQRNFYPLFPPPSKESLSKKGSVGVNLDVPYMRLADFVNVTPDVLVLPSMLAPSAKVVDGMLVVNPGSLSKRAAPGSFATLTIQPSKVGLEEAAEMRGNKVFERARVEVLRI